MEGKLQELVMPFLVVILLVKVVQMFLTDKQNVN
jgi:hypothetical protein